MFKNLDTRRGIKISYARDKDVAITINTYCANSAKTGNPNGEGLPKRPAYNPQENMIMEIQADGKAVGKPDPKKARLDVIEKEMKSGKLHKNGV